MPQHFLFCSEKWIPVAKTPPCTRIDGIYPTTPLKKNGNERTARQPNPIVVNFTASWTVLLKRGVLREGTWLPIEIVILARIALYKL